MLNIFGRGDSDSKEETKFSFREPTLGPALRNASNAPRMNDQPVPRRSATAIEALEKDMPQDFAALNAYFYDIVGRRKSPYNALVQAANRLQEFIPDEISRLKAARAICVEQWPADALSLALNTHIADIDLARDRIKASQGNSANERAARLRQQAADMRQRRQAMQEELDVLQRDLERKQQRLAAQDTEITTLQEQLSLMDADAAGVSLVDHAAENLKNDLQAKKILLGLSLEASS